MMNDKLSLTELQLIIRDSLYTSLPALYWVVAEISEIKENYAGHCYLELVEKHKDDINIRAKIRAIIWNKRYRFLKPLFESTTGESLKEGLKVLVKVKIEYHEIYGLSLIISDIDPAFTLGEVALRRQQILRKLEDEGVISMNKELDFPELPSRIAVISSNSAAGYTDFIKQLKGNSFRYSFHTCLFEAVMQGSETEESIIAALDMISENIGDFDVVVIIRGGGSQSDLSWFDNYNIAYHVTQFPLPVITGIGHEKDLSVTDIAAYRAEKTPTAVADFLINCMLEAEAHINQLISGITSLSSALVADFGEKIKMNRLRLIPVARMMLSRERERLSVSIVELINVGKDYLVREEFAPRTHQMRLLSSVSNYLAFKEGRLSVNLAEIKNQSAERIIRTGQSLSVMLNSLKILDPRNILKRGFTITSMNGVIITSATKIRKGDVISTRFRNGSVDSEVIENKNR
jgi:exodeoxyribonuclease VII large subunit